MYNWKVIVGFMEMFIPILFSGITYKMANNNVTYGVVALIASFVLMGIVDRIIRKATGHMKSSG